MKTRTGKIARLPKPIREQLNQRLENGELGTSLVQWLNQLPEVQKIITEQFAGLPIRPQNLSEWRKGGYLDWLRHQLLREQTRWTAEQSADLESDTGDRTMSIAEDIAMIMSAELALQVQALGEIKNPKERFRQFQHLTRELSRLRRDDQRAIRTHHRRDQWRYDHPQRPAPPAPKPEPVGDEVSSPKPYIPSIEDLKRLRIAAYFRQIGTPHTPEAPAIPVPPSPLAPQPSTPDPKPEPESTPDESAEQAPYNPPLPPPSSTLHPLSSNSPQPSAPIRPNPHRNYYDPRPPIRGRRFHCIEG